MGNSASSGGRSHQEETVDFGRLTPQGVYTGSKDWNHAIVTQMICERKLAPFYRPLEDYEDTWDDDQILAARKDLPEPENGHSESPGNSRHETAHSNGSKQSHGKRPAVAKDGIRCPEAAIYRGAVECPICFLYYPPNINHSRCCDQAICTECFVQIKRAEPTTTHIVSEPAACPYCVQDNFGVVYKPPPWRAGIGSDGTTSPQWPESPKGSQHADTLRPTHKRRQKSYGHDSPEVVTTDQIRPDWESKLAAVRAAVTRRANRRIIMRQVGDRLIPVGVTSGRVHTISPEEAGQGESNENGGSRRSRRQRNQNQDLNQFLGSMGLGGQDLEELMVMEAMRLSLVEHEEQQRREAASSERSSSSDPGATPVSADAEVPTALPSSVAQSIATSEPGSASYTPTPSAPSLAPASSIGQSSAVAQGRPSSIIESTSTVHRPVTPVTGSRKRTPSPTNPHASDRLHPPRQSSDWRRRSSSPRPFSTIAAAMSATSAATAILKGDESSTHGDNATGTSGSTSTPALTSSSIPAAISSPAPTVSSSLPATAGMPSTASHDSVNVVKPVRPPVSVQTDSYASSIFSTESTGQHPGSTYDVLESSPDSEFSREPLLGSSESGIPTIPEAELQEVAPSRVGERAAE